MEAVLHMHAYAAYAYAMSSLHMRNSIICYLLFNLPRGRKVCISRQLISRQSDHDVTNESINSTLVSFSTIYIRATTEGCMMMI
jgi:hypothetical protein